MPMEGRYHTIIRNEARLMVSPSTMEFVEIVSNVGGRALNTPILLCSPDSNTQWWSPSSYTKIFGQGTSGKQWNSGSRGKMGHFLLSIMQQKPWYDIWQAKATKRDWA